VQWCSVALKDDYRYHFWAGFLKNLESIDQVTPETVAKEACDPVMEKWTTGKVSIVHQQAHPRCAALFLRVYVILHSFRSRTPVVDQDEMSA
jgi:hypothetical protein